MELIRELDNDGMNILTVRLTDSPLDRAEFTLVTKPTIGHPKGQVADIVLMKDELHEVISLMRKFRRDVEAKNSGVV